MQRSIATMPQENSVSPNGNAQLELNDFILTLRLGVAKVRHKRILCQILAANQRELDRQANGEPGSESYLHDLRIYKAVALVVANWILNRLEIKVKQGKRGSKDNWKASRFLIAALDDFQVGTDQLSKHFPKRKLFVGLAERLQELFVDFTPERAEYLADALEDFILRAPLTGEKEQAA
jgi:hypothetical protein